METQIPAELRERFTPAEAPSFKVIRQRGDVRLWNRVHAPRMAAAPAHTGTSRMATAPTWC